MRKIVITTIAAFAGIAFATAAQAEGDCAWSNIATAQKPAVTADSGATTQQTPILTQTPIVASTKTVTPTKKDG
jgi:hypothetical protein